MIAKKRGDRVPFGEATLRYALSRIEYGVKKIMSLFFLKLSPTPYTRYPVEFEEFPGLNPGNPFGISRGESRVTSGKQNRYTSTPGHRKPQKPPEPNGFQADSPPTNFTQEVKEK